jgi:predicted PurR-regulated permease PerM
MALPVGQQVKYWGIAAAVMGVSLWVLGDVILPFVLGAAFAYCLDPVADLLERWGLPRAAAVVTITLLGLLLVVLAVLLIIPTLIGQAAQLVQTVPSIIANLESFVAARFPDVTDETSQMRKSLDQLGVLLQERGAEFLALAAGSVSGLFSLLTLFVITPVVTFYLLLDWDRMVARLDDLMPRDHAPAIRQLSRDIDRTLAGFIRGQGTVCLILGIYYAGALMLVGLDFGLVVGAVAGALTFIPYIGALVGGALALGLALFQFWGDWVWIAAVAAIFFSGQFLEGNVLTPKLVGGSVGLHPVWLLFALSAFGTLFGFVGMLVAVPLAAMIGVFVRFFLDKYLSGRLYRGLDALKDDPAAGPDDEAA